MVLGVEMVEIIYWAGLNVTNEPHIDATGIIALVF